MELTLKAQRHTELVREAEKLREERPFLKQEDLIKDLASGKVTEAEFTKERGRLRSLAERIRLLEASAFDIERELT